LSRHLDALVHAHDEFEALSQELSIATFRYVPPSLKSGVGSPDVEPRLDEINREVLTRLEHGGDAFLSNAVVDGKFALRACIVNFRTSLEDIEGLLPLIARIGREVAFT
jgi:glutamate/tyrosine decarboxylase-like PLP-dependent enzyme